MAEDSLTSAAAILDPEKPPAHWRVVNYQRGASMAGKLLCERCVEALAAFLEEGKPVGKE